MPGIIRSMKMRALDNVGAYAGRSPFQLGKPVGAIVGPYKIKSVQYQAIAVVTNKTRAGGGARLRPVADQLRHRAHHRRGGQQARPRPARGAPAQPDPPRGVPVSHPERLDLRQRRLSHRDRQGAGARRLRRLSSPSATGCAARGCSPASASRRAWSRAAATRRSSRCSIRKVGTTTWMDSCRISVDLVGSITATMHTTSAGQGHETLVGTVVGEVLEIDPDRCGWCGRTRSISLPSNSPVGSRMAIMLGGAAFHAAKKLKDKLIAIAAHDLGVPAERIAYGTAMRSTAARRTRSAPGPSSSPSRTAIIHRLPPDMEPGLSVSHIMPVPMGGRLPTADGRVQMYPCFSFEFHLMLVTIDPDPRQARDQALRHRPRLRHGDQSEDRARHDHGRHRPRHRRGALRGVRLQRATACWWRRISWTTCCRRRTRCRRSRSCITRRRRRTPCSARRARARAAISARRRRSRARSTTRCAPLGIVVNSLPIKVARLGDMIAAAKSAQ